MSSASIDGALFRHPKFEKLPLAAFGAWVKGLSWCAYKLSDGRISDQALKLLGIPGQVARTLVSAGLWDLAADGNGYVVHDYLEWNPSRDQVLAEREAGKKRAAKSRAIKKEIADGSTERHDMSEPANEQEHAPVYELTPTRFAERAGRRWFEALHPACKLDKSSWRIELGHIGQKPDAELAAVAEHVRATEYFQKRPSGFTPKHVLNFWHDFLNGPRLNDLKPVVASRSFSPAQASASDEFDRMEDQAWVNEAK